MSYRCARKKLPFKNYWVRLLIPEYRHNLQYILLLYIFRNTSSLSTQGRSEEFHRLHPSTILTTYCCVVSSIPVSTVCCMNTNDPHTVCDSNKLWKKVDVNLYCLGTKREFRVRVRKYIYIYTEFSIGLSSCDTHIHTVHIHTCIHTHFTLPQCHAEERRYSSAGAA